MLRQFFLTIPRDFEDAAVIDGANTLQILWQIPGGLPVSTSVKLVARARSYIGFTGADSLLTAIGDTLPQSL